MNLETSKKHRVLVISSILPIEEIDKKKDENNILYKIEDEICSLYDTIDFKYVFPVPFVFFLFKNLNNRFKAYYNLRKNGKIINNGRIIYIVPILYIPKVKFLNFFFYKLSLRLNKKRISKIIEQTNPTVIHAQNIEDNATIASYIDQKFNIPYITTLRSSKNINNHIIKNLKRSRKLIALSNLQKEYFQDHTSKEIEIVTHGISSNFLEIEKSPLIKNPIRLIVVCRLIALKNIDMVIRALSKLSVNFIFDIYGRGPEISKLSALVKKYNLEEKINLKGYVENTRLPEILSSYDLFVMPSSPETFGMVYLEAMACGIPIVCADDCGIAGIVENENVAIITKANDENDLYLKLQEILGNVDALYKMKLNASAYARMFSWDKISKKLYDLYTC